MFRLLLSLGAVAAATVFFSSCTGYRLGADKPAVMEGVQRIAVPLLRNETTIPRSSSLITNQIVRQFQVDGTYQIVDSAKADAIVRGTIRPLRRQQLRSDKRNTLRTVEQEVRLVIDYSVETRAGAVLATGTVEGSSPVWLDANFQRSEYQALDDAAARLALDLVSRLSEGWGSADLPLDTASSSRPPAYTGGLLQNR